PSGTITVVGTRFELMAEAEDLRVSVVEGIVKVAADGGDQEVDAGRIGRVVNGTSLPPEPVSDPSTLRASMDWMGNFFAWQTTPLTDAMRELGAVYHVAIEIEDERLARRTL